MSGLSKYILLKDTRNPVLRASVGNSLQLWLDASDSSTITEVAGAVSQWDDKSANGNDFTQGTGSAQPTTDATTQNGKNVIDFDGGDQLIMPSGLFSIPNGNNTMFIVAKRNTETAAVETLILWLDGVSGEAIVAYLNTAEQIGFRNGVVGIATKSGATNTNFQILRSRREGTTQAITFNSNAEASNTNAIDVPAADSGTLGFSPSGFSLTGPIAEVIIYNRSLTTSERTDIERYLATKWAIGISAPDNIGGLQLWLDANDSSTITESGGAVSQWDDKSGNGNDVTQGTASQQPIINSITQNGKRVLDFTAASNQSLQNTSFTSMLNGVNQPYTIFHVIKYTTQDISMNALSLSDASEVGVINFLHELQRGASNDYQLIGVDGSGVGIGVSSLLGSTGGFDIISNSRDAGLSARLKRTLNGAEVSDIAAIDVTFSNIDTITIGARNLSTANSRFTDGQIAEVIMYNRTLSTGERTSVELYLSNKYGIALA